MNSIKNPHFFRFESPKPVFVTRGHSWSIRGHSWSIRGHSWSIRGPSVVTRGHPWSLVVHSCVLLEQINVAGFECSLQLIDKSFHHK